MPKYYACVSPSNNYRPNPAHFTDVHPQGVTWIVMNEPVIIGKIQLEDFRSSVALHDDSKV